VRVTRPGLRVIEGSLAAARQPATADPQRFQDECVQAYLASWTARGFSPVTIENDTGVLCRCTSPSAEVSTRERAEALPVVGPSAVGDWGVGAVAEFGLLGAGGEGGRDVVPGGVVVEGEQDVLGQHPPGLVDEAGDQGDRGEGVAEPFPATLGEPARGVVDEVKVSSPLYGRPRSRDARGVRRSRS
jgi:hypothetical protein